MVNTFKRIRGLCESQSRSSGCVWQVGQPEILQNGHSEPHQTNQYGMLGTWCVGCSGCALEYFIFF